MERQNKQDFIVIGGSKNIPLIAHVARRFQDAEEMERNLIILEQNKSIRFDFEYKALNIESMVPNPIKSAGSIRYIGPKRRRKATNVTPKKKKRKK